VLKLRIDELYLPNLANLSRPGSWRKVSEIKAKIKGTVRGALDDSGFYRERRKPLLKASILIVRYGPREMDWEGLVASVKPVVDALKADAMWPGVFVDDSPKHIRLDVLQRIDPRYRVEIFVREGWKRIPRNSAIPRAS